MGPDDLAALLTSAPDPGQDGDDIDASCASALVDPSRFPPVIGLAAPERSLTSELRRVALVPACRSWPADERACLIAASDADAVAACLRTATDGTVIAQLVAASDALVGKLVALRAHPAAITCDRVVAEHYRDAAWAGKLAADLDARARRRLITASRAAMVKACDNDSWSADLRACVVAGGDDACFAAAGVIGATWGFPAIGVFDATGLPACDAYAHEVTELLACPKLSATSKEHFARTIQQSLERFAVEAREQSAATAVECETLRDAIRETESNLGCSP